MKTYKPYDATLLSHRILSFNEFINLNEEERIRVTDERRKLLVNEKNVTPKKK